MSAGMVIPPSFAPRFVPCLIADHMLVNDVDDVLRERSLFARVSDWPWRKHIIQGSRVSMAVND